ncbi:hypothetical protein QO010_003245 [Caulobacter ginsengisoli]|uniref:Cell envelope biogenesis protein TolA n=1 Tax=Caulobacter ginsengisoli TaxID=400775 RepID=A0ABU0ITX4_9CAUL|nr:hypothetical protein [Caulobacter ginsengisoli]MDQ0465458.1 hypothetical protein [Caulobacter ginsengisoli]
MAKLKVFQASFGFHDSVVATTSRPKALEAWGVRQDLFAEGMAREADDPDAIKAALAQPGAPLLRPIGDKGAFKAEAGAPKLPKGETAKRPAPDRARLTTAEKALSALAEEEKTLARDFAERRKALVAEEMAAREDWQAREAQARDALEKARAAYVRAGGRLSAKAAIRSARASG